MILSRVLLNPAWRDVWHWIRDPNAMHGALWRAFPHDEHTRDARAQIALLHRLEVDTRTQRVLLYVQADPDPQWNLFPQDALFDVPQTRSVDPARNAIQTGDTLLFRLRACPRREIGSGRSKHVPVEQRKQVRRFIGPEGGGDVAWLARQGLRYGFELGDVISKDASSTKAGARKWFIGRQFDGHLRVTDAEAFRATLRTGVGPLKAFGYGLLSVAPAGAKG